MEAETYNFQHTWIHRATHKTHKKGTRKQRSNNYYACFIQYIISIAFHIIFYHMYIQVNHLSSRHTIIVTIFIINISRNC